MGPRLAPKRGEAKPKVPEAVPTNQQKTIPIDVGPVYVCFDHDPKLCNCEIAQPKVGQQLRNQIRKTTYESWKAN